MKIAAPVLLAAGLLAGCATATPGPAAPGPAPVPCCASGTCAVPAFECDGRTRRDLGTGAPLFVAHPEHVASLAPRFNTDGTVSRDPETGGTVYEEPRDDGALRVLVALPR